MPGPASTVTATIETAHDDMVHDTACDWYGRRIATCSSDKTVKIFDTEAEGNYHLVDTLRGHEGPVWAVAWAHPKFGTILASSSFDGKVFVWREVAGQAAASNTGTQNGRWERIKEHSLHSASVNAIAWAPHELGPILACASSDSRVSVLTFKDDGSWDAPLFAAHNIGVNAISWAPSIYPSSLVSPQQSSAQQGAGQQPQQQQYVRKFATGGCDNLVKLWVYDDASSQWVIEDTLDGHSDWVRDVAFAPGIGLPRTYLASCSQDRTVVIWTQDAPGQAWSRKTLNPAPYLSTPPGGSAPQEGKFPDVVWRVSWSVTGNVLAVSAGDGKVSLWKESLKGEWECVSEVTA